MTQEFSFKYYISNYRNIEIYNFNCYFKNRINEIPNRTVSSKKIMEILNINNEIEKVLFRNAFMKYFKEKLYLDL